jgi:pimeloyl-ACP methyl ester carboxylesterase
MVALDILSATPIDGTPLDTRAASVTALVAAFLKALQLERPVLIGHSYGGLLALGLAASAGVEPSALALLAPAHPFAGYRPHVVAFYLTRWGRFWALCIPLAPSWAIRWAFNQAAGPAKNITSRHVAPHLRVLRHRDSLRRVLQILSTWETDMSLLRETMLAHPITLPALLLWGDHDAVVPIESASALDVSLAASERQTLTGCGHLLPEEATAACAALILEWLPKIPQGLPGRLARSF